MATKKRERKREITVYDYTYQCDWCGTELFEDEEPYLQVIEIYRNADQCDDSDRVRLEMCPDEAQRLWTIICRAIGADPSKTLRIGQD